MISNGGLYCCCTDAIAASRSYQRRSVYAQMTTEIGNIRANASGAGRELGRLSECRVFERPQIDHRGIREVDHVCDRTRRRREAFTQQCAQHTTPVAERAEVRLPGAPLQLV